MGRRAPSLLGLRFPLRLNSCRCQAGGEEAGGARPSGTRGQSRETAGWGSCEGQGRLPSHCLPLQFSPVAQSCPTLCDPINRSRPGLPVHHQLREFTQTHVHRVGDAIQPSRPLSSPSPPALNLSPLAHFKNRRQWDGLW